ncbi:MAG: protein kinase domain-containing protein [Chthoniobacterales bacterium]
MEVSAERWERAKAIVADALEISSIAVRQAFVAQECGDDASLRAEVESLLAQTTTGFDRCVDDASANLRQDTALEAGRRIDRYEIIRELGRGGMGAVYLARRADGEFDKQVAIKLLKRGTDTDEILRRFNAERQILARLQHPNIARLLDAGTTSDGLPYFVMEYVEGLPITTFARDKKLSLGHRLKLFQVVCGALSYAHRNLVVHRDLKPSNVLVTDDGEVKLLDFGIAKLLQTSEGDDYNPTMTIFRVMTPEYASPEQLSGGAITTLSDVYSLGVLFYEILTGCRPYRLKTRQPDEVAQAITKQEPQRPSTAVLASDDAFVPNRKLLRGDLDNIVLKAMRKEPERRYSSVDELSSDIRRHLEGLPVRARKDTYSYRASKFIRRHKLGLAAALLVLVTLCAGIITTTIQARNARRRFNQVRKLAHSVLFDYHDEIAALPGSTRVRERLVKDALEYLDNLSKEAGNDLSLLRELATAYEKVAAVQGGIAFSSHGTALASANLGDTKGAIDSLNRALAIRERVLAMEPDNKEMQQNLSFCHASLGELYMSTGPPDKAADHLRKALPIVEALLTGDPTNEGLQMNLVDVEAALSKVLGNPTWPNMGDTNGALEYLNKAQQLQEKLAAEHPTNLVYQLYVAGFHNNRGWVLSAMSGKLPEALENMQKALVIEQGLVKADPGNTLFRSQVAIQFSATGRVRLNMGDKHGALEDFSQGLSIAESLLKADPNDASTRRLVAVSYRNIAEALASNSDITGALNNFHQALQMFAELIAKDPINEDYQIKLASVYLAMSRVQSQADDLNGALDSVNQGIKINEVLVAASPTNSTARNTLAQLYSQLGASQAALAEKGREMEHWRAAKEAYQKSLDIYQDMKSKGTLSGTDDAKPDDLAREIAKCDAALR